MSPRPRTTTDEAILEAAQRAVLRVGPMRLTLADVGREAGVTPAALVKRFGSKRDLLLALIASGSEGPSAQFEQLSAIRSPVAAIYAYAACMADLAASPEILANNLAFLQMDLVDPEFHAHTLRHSNGVRRWIQSRLQQAVAAGELRACDTPRLARAVQVVVGGPSFSGRLIGRARSAAAFGRMLRLSCSRTRPGRLHDECPRSAKGTSMPIGVIPVAGLSSQRPPGPLR